MTDTEIHAELKRIDPKFSRDFDYFPSDYYREALRLLAESQQALREIIDEVSVYDDGTYTNIACESCKKILKLAKTAIKEEYRGPKLEPIPLVSLKCKCGYVLKPQDKSCPNCDKLFGKEE